MSAPLLEIRGMTKHFGGVAAVNDASFSVAGGSLTALIGPNGAGKTTMFNLVSGFIPPERGSVRFAGREIAGLRGDVVARAGLVRTFQTPRIVTRMSVLENMLLAGKDQPGEIIGMRWLAPGKVARREQEIRERAHAILELIKLSHLTHAYAGTLSGGQRKLLEFGRILMIEPQMILLDEPMAGVAPPLAMQLLEHVQQLRRERGITVLIIEHDMDIVMSVSERVVVMDEGRVIAEGAPAEIQRNARVIEAYLGRGSASLEPVAAAGGAR